jgi:hypothetical protein
MIEVFEHPEHVSLWHDAIKGEPDSNAILTGYVAAVDWPASAFWQELAGANPDAIVLLSMRDSPDAWWQSANNTVWESLRGRFRNEAPGWHDMVLDLTRTRFADPWDDEHKAKAAYEAHNQSVRDATDRDRSSNGERRTAGSPSAAPSVCRSPRSPSRSPTPEPSGYRLAAPTSCHRLHRDRGAARLHGGPGLSHVADQLLERRGDRGQCQMTRSP